MKLLTTESVVVYVHEDEYALTIDQAGRAALAAVRMTRAWREARNGLGPAHRAGTRVRQGHDRARHVASPDHHSDRGRDIEGRPLCSTDRCQP